MARASGGGFRGGARGGSGGGFKGGTGKSQRSGGRSAYGSGANGRTASSASSGNKSSAKSGSSKKVVAYSLYDSNGKRTYIGSTNDPSRRAAEHSKSGKLKKGGSLVVESPRLSRSDAQRLEAKKLAGYKSRTGRLPKGNKTTDGQFH